VSVKTVSREKVSVVYVSGHTTRFRPMMVFVDANNIKIDIISRLYIVAFVKKTRISSVISMHNISSAGQ